MKATQVLWKQKEQFEGLVVMMGGFHLLTTLLAIIGSHFSDASLRDVAVHSEVIAEGLIDSVLSGKHYNRGVRPHKIMYEAITIVNREEGLEARGMAKLCYCSMSRDNTSALKSDSVIQDI